MLEKISYEIRYGQIARAISNAKVKLSEDIRDFRDDECGMGTIEVVLILVVLIALVIIFRKSITELLKNIFDQINTDAESVYKPS